MARRPGLAPFSVRSRATSVLLFVARRNLDDDLEERAYEAMLEAASARCNGRRVRIDMRSVSADRPECRWSRMAARFGPSRGYERRALGARETAAIVAV